MTHCLVMSLHQLGLGMTHDDVIKWKHFPRYWPFVRGIHRSPVNSPHKGQLRGALMFSLIWASINGWVNNCATGDLRRYRIHYDVTVMIFTGGKRAYVALSFCSCLKQIAPAVWFTKHFFNFYLWLWKIHSFGHYYRHVWIRLQMNTFSTFYKQHASDILIFVHSQWVKIYQAVFNWEKRFVKQVLL